MSHHEFLLDDMVDRIQKVLIRRINPELDPAQLTRETPLVGRGLGLDSVAALELVMGLEEEFDLVIEDDRLSAAVFETIGSLAQFLTESLP